MPSHVARTKRMPLLIESLEERRTPAGNVVAGLSGTTLVITGDAQNNEIQIENSDPGTVQISGTAGTLVNGASSASFSSVNSIVIQMNQGNDDVYLGGLEQGLSVPGSLSVDLGAGDDELLLVNTTVNGSTTIRGRTGNDEILFYGFNTLHGSVLADLAQGDDRFEASNDNFNKSLRIRGGAGNDVAFIEDTTVGGTFEYQGQAGNDLLASVNSTLKKLVVDTGVGDDVVQLGSPDAVDGITVQTSATVLLGVGNDVLRVGNSAFGSTFFDGGPGFDVALDIGVDPSQPLSSNVSNTLGSPSSIVNFP